jgi:serine protease
MFQTDPVFARRRARLAAALMMVGLVSACGGGGGEPATPPPPPPPAVNSFTLSGSIQAADVSTVDTDTNDPNQTGFVPNDEPSTAQQLTSPITVVGAVNLVGKGPAAGRNFTVGDTEDWFRVSLKAGQVVELLVGLSASATNDADLCVVSTDAQNAACSAGTSERECVRAVADGDYYVVVDEFDSSSVYNLRISAPGAGVACSTEVSPASARVDGQLLAVHRPASTGVRGALAQPANQRVQALGRVREGGARVQAALAGGLPVDVIDLPASSAGRAAALAALAGTAAPSTAATLATRKRALAASPAPLGSQAAAAVDAADAAGRVWRQVHAWRYAKALQRQGGYLAVEPNWLVQTQGALVGPWPPEDVRVTAQRWHYEQIGLPAAMQALLAMNPQPTLRPVVAVLDDGVMLDHPDIAPQLLSRGRAFASVTTAGDNDRAEGESLAGSSDDSFHGSHVSGTAVAATFDTGNNSYGAGVAPMAQLLPVRVFRPDGRASSLDVAEGILYAARLANRSGSLPPRRADVINMSLGASSYVACPATYQTAITAARNAGVIVVAAAGNSGHNDRNEPARVSAPANCNGVLAVAATDALRRQTRYSNSGDELALAAPGGDGSQRTNGSGTPDSVFSAWGAFDGAGVRRSGFIGIDGTSMASPHVAGVMALMRWVNPAITPAQVDNLLQSGQLTDELGAAGKDAVFGWGLLNARKAVDAALASRGAPAPAATPVVATPSTLDFGSTATQITLRLAAAGLNNEQVTGISSDAAAITVVAAQVNANGQGDYSVRLDRTRVGAGTASYFPRLTVQLSPSRSFTVQLAFTVVAAGGAGNAAGGNVGPVYVLVYDPDTDKVRSTQATFANGRYSWQLGNYSGSRAVVAAGTDLDADDIVCQLAEVCGGYPVLSTDEAMTITLTGHRSGLDFSVSPLTDAAASALASAATANRAATVLKTTRLRR